MIPSSEKRYGVWIGDRRAGTLLQRGDRTRFTLDAEYRADPERPVLGLIFEQDLNASHVASVRLAPWFSNLLPEGRLREWIATERKVSPQREMELLIQVGHDLPGAVQVLQEHEIPADAGWDSADESDPYNGTESEHHAGWRFSLAGVGLKFSMVRQNDRLTLPAYGEGGDWIVKLPDAQYQDVPRNEYAMMTLAARAGINVPEIKLVGRDSIDGLPMNVWPNAEDLAYAIRRFDRDDQRRLIHMEDLAQVRNVYPTRKYLGNYETIASLIYRRHDVPALQEFARRLAFSIMISNGDAHLKNWSLLYVDPRIPTLSPAYDLVFTGYYRRDGRPEDLGLKFGGTKAFHQISLGTFARLQEKLGAANADLPGCVASVVEEVIAGWPEVADLLTGNHQLQDAADASLRARRQTLMRGLRA